MNEDEVLALMETLPELFENVRFDASEYDGVFEAIVAQTIAERIDGACVVTRGQNGCVLCDHCKKSQKKKKNDQIVFTPSLSGVRVIDTTGAGDAFTAGYLFARLHEANTTKSSLLGCYAAGRVVQTLGCALHPDAALEAVASTRLRE